MTTTESDVVPESSTAGAEVVSWHRDERTLSSDVLAVEEPLEIRLAGYNVAVTMRTPGDDFDLASGFLFTEGIIHQPGDIASIAHCPDDTPAQGSQLPTNGPSNIVNINPNDPSLVDPDRWRRNFFATSSCGLCGKASIEAVHQQTSSIAFRPYVSHQTLYRLGDLLRSAQTVFGHTGGLHAAGLFDLDGHLLTLREDVGRHNAVDKVVGDALRRGLIPLREHILMVSGRASFEIMQKALMAGIPVVAAVSAPSSLAVNLARSSNMVLIGFLRGGPSGSRFNIYAGADHIT